MNGIFFLFLKYIFVTSHADNFGNREDEIENCHGWIDGEFKSNLPVSCFFEMTENKNLCDFKDKSVDSFLILIFYFLRALR